MGATTYDLDSSHVPMLSHPDLVLDVIRTAPPPSRPPRPPAHNLLRWTQLLGLSNTPVRAAAARDSPPTPNNLPPANGASTAARKHPMTLPRKRPEHRTTRSQLPAPPTPPATPAAHPDLTTHSHPIGGSGPKRA